MLTTVTKPDGSTFTVDDYALEMRYEGSDDYEVWIADQCCIGAGRSQEEARADARQQLADWAHQVERLEAPTP